MKPRDLSDKTASEIRSNPSYLRQASVMALYTVIFTNKIDHEINNEEEKRKSIALMAFEKLKKTRKIEDVINANKMSETEKKQKKQHIIETYLNPPDDKKTLEHLSIIRKGFDDQTKELFNITVAEKKIPFNKRKDPAYLEEHKKMMAAEKEKQIEQRFLKIVERIRESVIEEGSLFVIDYNAINIHIQENSGISQDISPELIDYIIHEVLITNNCKQELSAKVNELLDTKEAKDSLENAANSKPDVEKIAEIISEKTDQERLASILQKMKLKEPISHSDVKFITDLTVDITKRIVVDNDIDAREARNNLFNLLEWTKINGESINQWVSDLDKKLEKYAKYKRSGDLDDIIVEIKDNMNASFSTRLNITIGESPAPKVDTQSPPATPQPSTPPIMKGPPPLPPAGASNITKISKNTELHTKMGELTDCMKQFPRYEKIVRALVAGDYKSVERLANESHAILNLQKDKFTPDSKAQLMLTLVTILQANTNNEYKSSDVFTSQLEGHIEKMKSILTNELMNIASQKKQNEVVNVDIATPATKRI